MEMLHKLLLKFLPHGDNMKTFYWYGTTCVASVSWYEFWEAEKVLLSGKREASTI